MVALWPDLLRQPHLSRHEHLPAGLQDEGFGHRQSLVSRLHHGRSMSSVPFHECISPFTGRGGSSVDDLCSCLYHDTRGETDTSCTILLCWRSSNRLRQRCMRFSFLHDRHRNGCRLVLQLALVFLGPMPYGNHQQCSSPPLKGEARTMRSQEWVNVWHDAALDGLELHHATYITHTFARHAHDYYVIGLIEAGVQSFAYRGARRVTPTGDVFVIHPGEAHTGEAVSAGGYTYRTLYPPVQLLQRAYSDIAGGEQSVPFFPTPVIHDVEVARCLRDLHLALTAGVTPLEREARFLQACALLITRYAEIRPPEPAI